MQDLRGPGAGAVNFAGGALTELAKQGGARWAQGAVTGGFATNASHKAVHSAAKMAPAAIAAAGAAVGAVALGIGALCLGRWAASKLKS